MKNKQKKAMSLPSLERVKDMAFIKRACLERQRSCLVTAAPCMCLCCWLQLSCATINNSSFAHLIFYY